MLDAQERRCSEEVLMSYASMYAGIGGFDLALTRAGWRCKWANEIDKYACQVYRKNFGSKELVEGDVRQISAETIPDIDLLVGGFPCQSFSLAGKREGFADIRGTLFFEIARIARAKRPSLLLLENVKGLLSNDGGRTFGTILEELGSIGYWVEWQTLNSKHFGVPQNRERVFIVGHLRERSTRQIFPIRETGPGAGAPCGEAQGSGERLRNDNPQCANTLSARYHKDGSENLILQQHHAEGGIGEGNFRVFEGISPTLTQLMGTGGNNVPMVLAPNNFQHETGDPETRGRRLTDIVPSLQAEAGQTQGSFVVEPAPAETLMLKRQRNDFGKQIRKDYEAGKTDARMCEIRDWTPVPRTESNTLTGVGIDNLIVQPCLTPDRMKKRQNGRRFKENGEPSFTLTGQDIHGVMIGRGIRRFTPKECERLQGFPDDWTLKGIDKDGNFVTISDTQRYKMCGNAVTVSVIECLGKLLLRSLALPTE